MGPEPPLALSGRAERAGESAAGMHEPAFALHVEDLTASYARGAVLWDVDMNVPRGVLAAIVGPNGAGKSTLLKCVIGALRPAAGHVYVFGRTYRRQRHRVAYVPQRTSVDWDFPTTALDVVTMGLYGRLGWLRRPGRREADEAHQALAMVGMDALADRQISQLSGGQQQRVFLARALVQDADLYLMDEPFAGVDATTERAIVELLKDLRARGKTVVAVHHDLQTVATYFDWLAILNVRMIAQGRLQDVYTAEHLRAAYGPRVVLIGASSSAEVREGDEAGAGASGDLAAESLKPAATDRGRAASSSRD